MSTTSSGLEISVIYTIRNCISVFTRAAAGLYHESADSITLGTAVKTLLFPPVPCMLSRFFPSHFLTYYIDYLINPMHATYPTYLILLYFVILMLLGGKYEF
jgi:hypothetical protein